MSTKTMSFAFDNIQVTAKVREFKRGLSTDVAVFNPGSFVVTPKGKGAREILNSLVVEPELSTDGIVRGWGAWEPSVLQGGVLGSARVARAKTAEEAFAKAFKKVWAPRIKKVNRDAIKAAREEAKEAKRNERALRLAQRLIHAHA